jgi:hypothetical protein
VVLDLVDLTGEVTGGGKGLDAPAAVDLRYSRRGDAGDCLQRGLNDAVQGLGDRLLRLERTGGRLHGLGDREIALRHGHLRVWCQRLSQARRLPRCHRQRCARGELNPHALSGTRT